MHLVLIPTAEDYSAVLRILFPLFLVISNYSFVVSISERCSAHSVTLGEKEKKNPN